MIEISKLGVEDYLIRAASMVFNEESKINDDDKIYLITWSPDPSRLPDADFSYQHLFNVNILSDYLKYCSCGLFVHEFTQLGNPHYHGWYQVNTSLEHFRCAIIKVLDKLGNLKITSVKSSYKINNYTRAQNALGYYKKETFDKVLPCNPIDKDTVENIDWNTKLFFFVDVTGRKKVSDLIDTISNKKYYTAFYKKSD